MTTTVRDFVAEPAGGAAGQSVSSSPPGERGSALSDHVWVALIVAIALTVAVRIGVFDVVASVAGVEGTPRLTNPFAGVDHPFHAARAETLRRALADGYPLRWVSHHQGGYPVEFYPLGVAWLEVGVWALLLGALPLAAVHSLVVGLIFVLPGVAFTLMARGDRWPLAVALTAFVAHVVVPGGWWHGGYTELVQWGLVTNVAASVALLLVLPLLTAFMVRGGRVGVAAALVAAFAVYCNPRGLVALAVIGVGVWLTVVATSGTDRVGWRAATTRLGAVAALAAALAAPEVIALARFADLYYFVRYEWYDSPAEYLRNTIDAVSPPVLLLAAGGMVAGWRLPGRPVTRAAATTLALYIAATLALSAESGGPGIVAQLEETRLMPFQRLLTLYLAAVALHGLARRLVDGVGARAPALADALQVAAAGALAVAFVTPSGAAMLEPGNPAVPTRGLFAVATAAVPAQVAFRAAVEAADAAAPPGTTLLVLGSGLSWHQQLWAPTWVDRAFLYDNWLWSWHPWHAGPPGYDYRAGHCYAWPEFALERDFLDRHGVGAVIVAETPATARVRDLAGRAPELAPVIRGTFDVYAVRDPTAIVTRGDQIATALDDNGQRLTATIPTGNGSVLVRRTWHPRWRAEVDGEPAAIARVEGGYMRVAAPVGAVRLDLVYVVDRWDWVARIAAFGGLLAAAVVGSGGVKTARWRPISKRRSGPVDR